MAAQSIAAGTLPRSPVRAGSETVLYAAAAFSLCASVMHLWAAPEHYLEWWGYGVFFTVIALAQGLYAVALLRWRRQDLLALGIFVNLGLAALYFTALTAGPPLLGPHAWVPEEPGAVGIAAVGSELALAGALVVYGGLWREVKEYLALGVLWACSVGAVMHFLHAGAHGMSPLVHWLWMSASSVPLAVLVAGVTLGPARRLARGIYGGGVGEEAARGLVVAMAYALASILANPLAGEYWRAGGFAAQSLRDASVVLGVSFALVIVVSAVRRADLSSLRRPVAAIGGGLLAAALLVSGPTIFGYSFTGDVQAQSRGQCSAASYDRSYSVSAINVKVPYNRWGGLDPHGQVFALSGDSRAVKNWFRPLAASASKDPAGNRRLRPRPLVLRANAGECVKVKFTNQLKAVGGDGLPNNPRASMKVFGPSYNARTSDGSVVGRNPDTTVGRNQTISYFWKTPSEGTYIFRDEAALAGSEANSGSISHGLYGALVVEPAGSRWRDPETGKALYNGAKNHTRITKHSGDPYVDADIIPPGGKAFRETVQLSQDELPGGNGFGFNYGAEPGFNRIATNPAGEGATAEQLAPDAVGEETSLSSWTYGDPGLIKLASGLGPWLPVSDGEGGRESREDCGLQQRPGGSCYVSNVTHAYVGDPTKVRFAHAGVKETHVFHMHAHQWRMEPRDGKSTTIDSQTYGPGEAFTAELIGGAGSKPGTFGDSIFHCHLYPHFADGFWAIFRVHDVLEDGSGRTPDGVKVRALTPLPSLAAPPQPTANNPGYPRFIPGEFSWRAPQPPGGIFEPAATADNPSTVAREDLRPATRVVAGRPLDSTLSAADPLESELRQKLAVEERVQDRYYGNTTPKAGAPFTDPCPVGARELTYNVSVIQTPITYNEAGWRDRQGRILVLNEDADDVLAGRKKPEPLFIRANAGDCINFNLTNRLPNFFGGDEFVQLVQTNMVGEHIHLVKFDVLGSDGASNGWNYQQAAFTKEQAAFNDARDADEDVANCDRGSCRIPTPPNWDPDAAGAPPGQTISERWYADYELRTVFTHDHHFPAVDQNRGLFGALIVEPKGMDFRNPKTGAFYQPINSASNGPVCGPRCNADAVGTAMDVIGPGPGDDFREFGLAFQDFVSLHKPDGTPVAPPVGPEPFPDDDPGVMGINYSNAPFVLRQDRSGVPTDPAYVFSSTVHGDPATPLLETYSQDPVRLRVIQGSQEEQHVFNMHGVRWRQEPDDRESPLVNSQALGVSDAFNFEVPKLSCAPGDAQCTADFLYSSAATDDLYLGMWGLLRARGEPVPSLLPLPDNVPGGQASPQRAPSALSPPEAELPGKVCPAGVPTKRYNVVALQTKLKYNKYGDHDPYGLIYALAADEKAIRNGSKKPTPLVLRANEGDCIEVRLTNKLTRNFLNHRGISDGDPVLPSEPATGTRAGLRVSLHPQLLKYDVRGSDGATVGFNRDQTVGPGESILYRWYADNVSPGELGTINLTDYGDVRGHRHHGLFAGLTIEPKGSTYHNPRTGKRISSGATATIRVPGKNNDFREHTLFFQDGLNLRDKNGRPVEDPPDHPPTPEEPIPGALDPEDQGEKGFNYRNAPFDHRIGEVPESGMNGGKMANVFNSRVHGDPDTPILKALAGDRVRVRLLQGADKPRQNSFQLSGYSWRAQPEDPGSTTIGTQGGISVSRAFNLHLRGATSPGDYRYGTGFGFHQLPGGLWGILRVYPKGSDELRPLEAGRRAPPKSR